MAPSPYYSLTMRMTLPKIRPNIKPEDVETLPLALEELCKMFELKQFDILEMCYDRLYDIHISTVEHL